MSAGAAPREVKVCGVRTPEGARACAESGVDFAGVNRVPGVARAVRDADMPQVLAALGDCVPVLVVRNQPVDQVIADALHWGVPVVQLHGDEPASEGRRLRAAGLRVVKAMHLAQARDPDYVAAWSGVAWRFVVDGRDAGSGKAWRWGELRLRRGALGGVPVWLAGGLRPGNVAAAIAAVSPAGVDTASGVESPSPVPGAPAEQDPARIAAFVTAARQPPVPTTPSPGATTSCN